ncbi:MAG: MBL fold metallo-hydrolase [Candidatus Acidiferrales bacterium]
MAESWLKFLGTAGARFVVTKQLRASGGLWACLEGVNFLVDPGPGCLVRCLASKPKLEPTKLDAILLSHRHIDHSNDINIMMEAMTEGGFKRRGRVFAPREALEDDPVVLRYVREYVDEVITLRVGVSYSLGNGVTFRPPILHQHGTETYGFIFSTPSHTISYIACTLYFPELVQAYAGCDLLLINTVRLKPEANDPGRIKHMTLEDVRALIEALRPRTAILTHFGMTMLRARPWELARTLSQETGVEVIAASDGLRYELA